MILSVFFRREHVQIAVESASIWFLIKCDYDAA